MTENIDSSQLFNILKESVEEIFLTMAGLKISYKEVKEVNGFSITGDITGLMFLESDQSGMIACSVSYDFARTVATGMTGIKECDVTDKQANDIMAEIINMICGRIKSQGLDEKSFSLTPPLSISGNGHTVLWKTDHPALILTFEGPGGPFDVISYM
jgi:CheY-specific phosphatase CheX